MIALTKEDPMSYDRLVREHEAIDALAEALV